MSEQLIPKRLAEKLAAARKEARTVKKRGEGGEGNDTFRFARSEDVGKEARRLQRKHGFFVIPAAPNWEPTMGKSGVLITVGMRFKVVDAETGEYFMEEWVGTGFDRQGSGAASIATTTATKAFTAGLLGIAFEPDPEERRPKADAAELSEPIHILNVGSILHRLSGVGLGDDLDALNRLLGSCNLDALEESPQPLKRRSLQLPASDASRIEAELQRLEQDHHAEAIDG